jgi:hypothetical protein
MARLFLSYSHEDRPFAEKLALALTARDHEVWWDRNLGSGSEFRREINRQLRDCEAAIVIWSQHALVSAWVLDEADQAVGDKKYLPVSCEPNLSFPTGLGQFHVVDLSAWDFDERAPLLDEIDKEITEIEHGNFRGAIQEFGRRFENRGGKTAAALISSVGSNIGGLPVLRLITGAAAAGGGLALLQTLIGLLFGGGPLDYLIAAIFYIFAFFILRMAHQPVAIRLGRGRRFFDDAFAFWLVFSLFLATLYIAAMSLFGSVEPRVFIDVVPPFALTLVAAIVFLRLFWTAFSFMMRKV